jgi:antiviral helicase SKI2
MKDVIASLQTFVQEWSTASTIPEVDWSRLRALEFQELLRSRDSVVEKLRKRHKLCPCFPEHAGCSM